MKGTGSWRVGFLSAAIFLTTATAAVSPLQAQESEEDEVVSRLEAIVRDEKIPSYEDLRLPADTAREARERFLLTVPLLEGDVATSQVVFSDVPADGPYALLTLPDLVEIALNNNFDLINDRRDIEISRSNTRSAEAEFIPFVDFVSSGRITYNRNEDAVGANGKDATVTTVTDTESAGLDAGVNLPSGGSVTFDVEESHTRTRTRSGAANTKNSPWGTDAEVRFLQPLLRGGGFDVGTADLRSARLSEMDRILGSQLSHRDTVLQVVRQYFDILSVKQQLMVSRDAITERYRFLDETRVKFDVGRVAESEILRAQIQFLQEVETAINRQESLDNARESLLILLGLPLDTPISLIDITQELRDRGRIEIPKVDRAVAVAMNNRYELMRSDISISQAEINQRVSRNDLLPQLDFDAGYRRYDSETTLRGANEWDNSTLDAGLTLRIPLQNIQRREAHKRAVLRVEQAETDRLSLERSLMQEVYSTHRSVLSTEANLTILRKTVEQARRNLELINGSFEVGFSTITEVRLAQDDLFAAETRYNNAILNYQVAIARLYVALGLPLY
ncbi:TolC family protein [bacterium]|nr:TolC family protein [bacterium]